jgi:hypothetical protein
VVLLEPTEHIGGMITSGLGGTDHCNRKVIGGLAREFFKRNGKHYKGKGATWRVTSSVGEALFKQLLKESGIEAKTNARLKSAKSANDRLSSVVLESGTTVSGKIFIDASYEGDLLAASGVSYTVGREAAAQYNESHAGVHRPVPERQTPARVPALRKDGSPVPGIDPGPMPPFGTGDRRVMAYNYRLCLTDVPGNMRPLQKPGNYDRSQFELLHRLFSVRPATRLSDVLLLLPLPDDKVDLNSKGPLSTDLIGGADQYPKASEEQREEIRRAHEHYTRSLLYFLGNDKEIPPHVRETMKRYGLCADEFVDNNNWPYQLYVREARRMLGEYVLRESDLSENPTKEDSIGMASCPVESHHVQGYVDKEGFAVFEGWATMEVPPYEIPYRSITPKKKEASNLLVPVAISASHVAFSSMRMEPVFMILGEASGIAASLAIKGNSAVQDVDVQALQKILIGHAAVLSRRNKRFRDVGAANSR